MNNLCYLQPKQRKSNSASHRLINSDTARAGACIGVCHLFSVENLPRRTENSGCGYIHGDSNSLPLPHMNLTPDT